MNVLNQFHVIRKLGTDLNLYWPEFCNVVCVRQNKNKIIKNNQKQRFVEYRSELLLA